MSSSSPTQHEAASAPPAFITWDDLNNFYAKHFQTDDQQLHNHDSGIMCYADGVERMLTDEEIAIFRHSELQQLIRQHRLAQENSDAPDSPRHSCTPKDRTSALLQANSEVASPAGSQSNVKSESSRVTKAASKPRLPSKRGQKRFYKPEKQDKEQYTQDSDERTFRRICREADEIEDETIELDY